MSHRTNNGFVRRMGILAGAVGIAAGTSVLAAQGVSAGSTAAKASGGSVHIDGVNTGLSATSPVTVLITGAFSDHGKGKGKTWHLQHGSITFNTSALKAKLNSPTFGTFYPASCSYDGVAKAPVTIVSGTGAYAGIKGTITVTATVAEQGSLLKNGQCNTANNAPAVADTLIITGSGKVMF